MHEKGCGFLRRLAVEEALPHAGRLVLEYQLPAAVFHQHCHRVFGSVKAILPPSCTKTVPLSHTIHDVAHPGTSVVPCISSLGAALTSYGRQRKDDKQEEAEDFFDWLEKRRFRFGSLDKSRIIQTVIGSMHSLY